MKVIPIVGLNGVSETLVEYSMELFDSSNMNWDNEYIVDVMECSIERPKSQELQREFYSCKKKKTYH